MNQSNLISSLQNLGLTDREISVYISVLDNKKSSLVPLAKHSNLPPTTAQYLLEKLSDKGLIRIGEENGRKRYYPTAPEKVVLLLQKQRDNLEAQITSLKEALPDLMRRFNTSPYQPRVRIFPGEKIKDLYDDILDQSPGMYHYTCANETIFEAVGRRFLDHWIKERIKRKIWSYGVRVREEEVVDPLYTTGKENYRELRLGPDGFTSPALVVIYGDNVGMITSAQESFGVVITSKDYAETMRAWFNQLWERST